jgi:UDP-N-acetylmuramoyl-tripeptide--D-alanyl-D-alanine ligase
MDNALIVLDELFARQGGDGSRCVFICADMAELGEHSIVLHEQLGRRVAESHVDVLITVGELSKLAAETAKADAGHRLKAICFNDAAGLCDNLDELVRDHDVILLKGSRVARLEIVVERLKRVFSKRSLPQARYAVIDRK